MTHGSVRRAKIQADASARGSANEDLVADLLNSVFRPSRAVTRASVLDSSGHRSTEQDIIVCNEDQLLLGDSGRPQLLIVEGVDFVVQVKARLSTGELKRITTSCMSVKQCHKIRFPDDMLAGEAHDRTTGFLDHVPYYVLCFESALSPVSALSRLNAMLDDVHPAYRPDGVFVLDRFALLRSPAEAFEDEVAERLFVLHETAELTLARFMFEALTAPPRVRRRR